MDNKAAEMLLENTRLSKKRTEKLERIDVAAVELFSRKGYANTSSKEIAELAQVAEGTIFRHYGTKENLLVHILLRFIDVLLPIYKKEFVNDLSNRSFATMEEFTSFFVGNRLAFVKKNRNIFKVFIKEIVYDDALRNSLLDKYAGSVKSVMCGAFDSVKDKGRLEGVPYADLTERLLITVLPEFVWMFVLTERYKTMDEDKWVKNIVKRFTEGI